jgi:hypothetical protein
MEADPQLRRRSLMSSSFYTYLSTTILKLPINRQESNAIFVYQGKYSVRVLKGISFDEAVERMERYNQDEESLGRCLMVKGPNVVLRALTSLRPKGDFIGPFPYVDSMITACAEQIPPKREPMKSGFKGIIGDEYLIPDRRQDAADMLSDNDDLVALAEAAMNMAVSLNGKTPFEGAPR